MLELYEADDYDVEDIDDDAYGEIDAMLEDLEDSMAEDEDLAERRRRRRRPRRPQRRPTPRSGGKGLYQAPAPKNYVTHAQLKSALQRVESSIKKNGAGIQKLDKDVSVLGRRLSAQDGINRSQSKVIKDLKQDAANTKQMLLMMSLLSSSPKFVATQDIKQAVSKGAELPIKAKEDKMDKLLPLMLLGGGLGTNGGSGGAMDNPLMLILLMDALDKD